MLWSNKAGALQLRLCSRAGELQLLKPACPRVLLCKQKATAMNVYPRNESVQQ